MSSEQQPFLSHGEHFEIDRSLSNPFLPPTSVKLDEGSSASTDTAASDYHATTLLAQHTELFCQDASEEGQSIETCHVRDELIESSCEATRFKGANVFQTSLNIAKLCMGTGTLALPFASEKGGLLFNVVGLGLIGLWNFYSANCLLRCLEFLPPTYNKNRSEDKLCSEKIKAAGTEYGTLYGMSDGKNDRKRYVEEQLEHDYCKIYLNVPPPPDGTTTYGVVAWYACGPKGKSLFSFKSQMFHSPLLSNCCISFMIEIGEQKLLNSPLFNLYAM